MGKETDPLVIIIIILIYKKIFILKQRRKIMSIIVHARVEKGIIKPVEDIYKLGIKDGDIILEIKKSKVDEIYNKITPSNEKLIEESIELTEIGADLD